MSDQSAPVAPTSQASNPAPTAPTAPPSGGADVFGKEMADLLSGNHASQAKPVQQEAPKPPIAPPATPAKTEPEKDADSKPTPDKVEKSELETFMDSSKPETKNRFNDLLAKEKAKLEKEIRSAVDAENWKGKHDELSKKYQDREAVIQRLDVQQSEAFQQAITQPREEIKARISQIAQENEIDAGAFSTLLTSADTRAKKESLDEMLEKLTSVDRDEVAVLRRSLSEINKNEKKILDDPARAKKAMEDERHTRLTEYQSKLKESRLGAIDPWLASAKEDAGELFEEGSDFNIDTIAETMRNGLGNGGVDQLRPDVQVQIIGTALMAKPLVDTLRAKVTARDQEIASLKEKLAQYDTASPEMEAGASAASPSKESFEDQLSTFFKRK